MQGSISNICIEKKKKKKKDQHLIKVEEIAAVQGRPLPNVKLPVHSVPLRLIGYI